MTDKEKIKICTDGLNSILRVKNWYGNKEIVKFMREIANETLNKIEE